MSNLFMSPEDYAKKLWDWTPLNAAFSRGIRLTDIDGMVEASGKFLFVEGKSVDEIPKGQRMALERLARLPGVTVVFLHGDPPARVRGWQPVGGEYTEGDYPAFVQFVHEWFESVGT